MDSQTSFALNRQLALLEIKTLEEVIPMEGAEEKNIQLNMAPWSSGEDTELSLPNREFESRRGHFMER